MVMVEKEVDIAEYIRLFLRYKYLIAIILIVFASLGFLFYKFEVPTYSATAYLEIGSETIGKSYDISYTQQISSITTLATSYPFIYRVANNLELQNFPIKPTLLERLYTRESLKYLNSSTLVYYYMSRVRVSQRRGSKGIIQISTSSQDRKLAADIANEVGKLIVDDNIKEKERLLQRSTDFIDRQLESVEGVMEQNRREKEKIEMSETYNAVVELQDKLLLDENSLNLFLRERESLTATITLDLISGEAKKESEEKLEYVNRRINELKIQIEDQKKRLNAIDKTDFYRLKNIEFAIETDQKIYQSLISERQRLVLADLIGSQNIKFLSRAYMPLNPDRTKGLMIILVFIGVGGMFAFGIIQLLEIMSRRFKSSKEVEEELGAKVIGNLPIISKEDEFKLLTPNQHPRSSIVESYRTLATNIKFASKGKKIKTITFLSDKARTGKSSTVANLATVMSETGEKVLIVDADLRRPNQHKVFNLNRKPGLTEILAGKSKLDKSVNKVRPKLHVLTAGSLGYNPQSIFESEGMKKFIKNISKDYDYVFFDSIPLTTFSESVILASETDATIMVMDERRSEKDTMKFSKERIDDSGANLLGIAVNRTKRRYAKYYYQYYYHYHEKPQRKGIVDFIKKKDIIEENKKEKKVEEKKIEEKKIEEKKPDKIEKTKAAKKKEREKKVKERREKLKAIGSKIKNLFKRKKK